VSRDPILSVAGIDPTVDGATANVFNSAGGTETACFTLPSVNWRRSPAGFKYRDATMGSSPVGSASLKNGSQLPPTNELFNGKHYQSPGRVTHAARRPSVGA